MSPARGEVGSKINENRPLTALERKIIQLTRNRNKIVVEVEEVLGYFIVLGIGSEIPL